jgi:hypothetical protein
MDEASQAPNVALDLLETSRQTSVRQPSLETEKQSDVLPAKGEQDGKYITDDEEPLDFKNKIPITHGQMSTL